MEYYTKQQIKELEDMGAVNHFNTVIDSQFKRGTTSDFDNKVADIYDAATGGKVNRNFGCKLCSANLYRNAGQLYRKSVAYYKQQKADQMRKAREAKQNKPDVEMKDGIITINLDKHE